MKVNHLPVPQIPEELHLVSSFSERKRVAPFSLRKYDMQSPLKKHRSLYVKRTIPLKVRKSVKFAKQATSRSRSISKTDLEKAWYQPKDYDGFEQEMRDTIRAVTLVNGDIACLNPTKFCIQGLEQQLTKRQIFRRRMHAVQYTNAILHQQDYQRFSGINDPQSLRVVSEMFSQQEAKRAYMRAVIHHSFTEQETG